MKRFAGKVTALSLLFATGHVAADVFYSGLQDTTIPTTYGGINIDVDGVGGWDLNPFMGGFYLYNNTTFQPARDGTDSLDTVLNFSTGEIIDGSLNFSTGTGGSLDHLGTEFTAGDEGYLGFKLNGTDYGWMRVVFTNNTGGALIKDWGYNTGGGSIAAGNVLQSGSTYTLDSSVQSFALGSAITGSNSLVKNGANTVTLNADNTFIGTTSINTGTLAIGATGTLANTSTITVASGATFDVSAVAGGWTLGAAQTLTGGGGVTGNATIAGTHRPGTGLGSQAFTGDLGYTSGSIFAWDLTQSSTSAGFDTVSATGAITVSGGSVFHIVLGSSVLDDMADPGNTFWNLAPYHTVNWDLADIFDGASFTAAFSGVTTSENVSAYGSFSISSSTLTWTAIPEPTSALAGLLLGAGLLRRRRRNV